MFKLHPTNIQLHDRREQIAELTRLGQTLMHIERLFWIVADDSEVCNSRLDKFLDNFGEYKLKICARIICEGGQNTPLF